MSHPTAWSPDLYARAARFAGLAHLGQTVPGSELPYLLHVCSVAAEVLAAHAVEPFDDPGLAVACALLHDTIEDTHTTLEELETEFGNAVAAGVSALTKDDRLAQHEAMANSLARIREQPREVWAVKLADRITNLSRPPAGWSPRRAESYRVESLTIADVLGAASAFLGGRLRAKIDEYRQWCG